METPVDISLSQEVDEAMMYYFYYQLSPASEDKVFLGLSRASDETAATLRDVLLPPGTFTLLIDICSRQNLCKNLKTEIIAESRTLTDDELRYECLLFLSICIM